MNPRADMFWDDGKGEYRPLLNEDAEEIDCTGRESED